MSRISHIVFDIGNVLLRWDPELIYIDRIADHEERRWFLKEVCSPQWNIERDLGGSFADGEAELIRRHPDHEDNIRAYFPDWHKSIPNAVPGVAQLMVDFIRAGHDVTMLTNFSAETFPVAVGKYPFLREPRGVTVSGEVGMVKPDPEIYRLHESRFALENAATLFIDDSAANIEAARRHGWHGIVFSSAEQLKAELAVFGLH
ncbi:MAG: HAD family phosphatase [Nitratireductor sp.]|nr:HAD family phosphatase [Nitratireductor sp.]